eukprot:2836075-Rhodomonas_salina.3
MARTASAPRADRLVTRLTAEHSPQGVGGSVPSGQPRHCERLATSCDKPLRTFCTPSRAPACAFTCLPRQKDLQPACVSQSLVAVPTQKSKAAWQDQASDGALPCRRSNTIQLVNIASSGPASWSRAKTTGPPLPFGAVTRARFESLYWCKHRGDEKMYGDREVEASSYYLKQTLRVGRDRRAQLGRASLLHYLELTADPATPPAP